MNHAMRRAIETAACERRYGIADEKGAEYSQAGANYQTGDADVLLNFKEVAKRTGTTPVQVLLNYMLKHVDSITTTCREAEWRDSNTDVGRSIRYAQGEGIVSRLDDLRNYADLLECLLVDTGAIEDTSNYEVKRQIEILGGMENVQKLMGEDIEFDAESDKILKQAGLVEGLDGVWRGASKIDKSVKNPGEKQTPIYAKPAVFEPTQDKIREPETGELS